MAEKTIKATALRRFVIAPGETCDVGDTLELSPGQFRQLDNSGRVAAADSDAAKAAVAKAKKAQAK